MPHAVRSLLFVPGNRPERIDKALGSGADRVIIDLEDAVAPQAKDEARAAVAHWLATSDSGHVVLRINSAETAWFEKDLALCSHARVAGVMVPKAEEVECLAAVRRAGARSLWPLIESAAGFGALGALAGAEAVERLAFGSIDFQLDMCMRDAHEEELLYFRSQLVLASRLARVAPPIDGVSTAIDDAILLQQDAQRARRLGFAGKLCIHPRQVPVVNASFDPSPEELAWAQRVLEAARHAGGAAVAVDGKMVDKPVILKAQGIVGEAGER